MKKNKNRKQFFKCIGTLVCALVVAVSFMCSVPYYANDVVSHVDIQDFLSACGLPQLNDYRVSSKYLIWDIVNDVGEDRDNDNGTIKIFEILSGDIVGYVGASYGENTIHYRFTESSVIRYHTLRYGPANDSVEWVTSSEYNCSADSTVYVVGGDVANVKLYYTDFDIYTDSSKTDIAYAFNTFQVFDIGVVDSKPIVFDKYNSSLGYLQDIKGQFLYLENDAWDLVEDTAVNKYTFSNITTTGLDITDGDWDIRLYGQLVIRDLDNEAEITVYDKVYLGEYSASDLKIMIPYKETNEQINNASGFDGLSWWESEFLHYYTFYNTYLQLVRTNPDGTVEYGGFLKIWKASNNVTYTDTLDENGNVYDGGYVNKPIENGSHGSGSTYEEAEKDAVKNEEEREQHNADMSDLENALSGFTSTLGVIPNVISSVFSFLPPWCLNTCAVGFGLLIVLIIWKTARG